MIIRAKSTRRRRTGELDPELALDLAEHAVGLMQRQPDGTWRVVASANLTSSDFSRQLDDLRVEACVRAPANNPIELWLPQEQVLRREYTLYRSGMERAWEARDRIAADTGHTGEELMIACTPGQPGAPAIVLAALAQSIEEARSYARSWGFRPGSVSTRIASDHFGETRPIFRPANPGALPALFRLARFSTAACVAGLAFFGASALLKAAPELISSAEDAAARSHMVGMVTVIDDTHGSAPDPLRPVWTGKVQNLGIQALRLPSDDNYDRLAMTSAPPNTQRAAPQLGMPVLLAEMTVGPPPSRPSYVRPGRLSVIAVLPPRPAATIRVEDSPAAQNGAAAARTVGNEDTQNLLNSPPTESLHALTRSSLDHAPEEGASSAVDSEVTYQAANAVQAQEGLIKSVLPRPRPILEITEARSEKTVSLTPVPDLLLTSPSPRPEMGGSSASVLPIATLQATPPDSLPKPPTTTQTDIAESTDAEEGTATQSAVLASPQPLNRPRTIERQNPVRAKTVPLRQDTAPRTVQAAAARQGLSLGETSLIGVLQGTDGHEAILRLEGGGYARVREGDMIGDWRVGKIGRENLRLTRGGQNRMLVLVSR